MSNADRDEVDELITRTRARGSVTITTGEIFSALPKLEPETDELQAIFQRIQASGFDIIDEVIDDIRREDERRRRQPGQHALALDQQVAARRPPGPDDRLGRHVAPGQILGQRHLDDAAQLRRRRSDE